MLPKYVINPMLAIISSLVAAPGKF